MITNSLYSERCTKQLLGYSYLARTRMHHCVSIVGRRLKNIIFVSILGGETVVFVRNPSKYDSDRENLINETADYVHHKLRTKEKIIVDFEGFEKHVKSEAKKVR